MSMTIGELRKQLDAWEADWTESDDKFLGTFESQAVLTDHFDWQPHRREGENTYQGIGPAKLIPSWELGLVFAQDENDE